MFPFKKARHFHSERHGISIPNDWCRRHLSQHKASGDNETHISIFHSIPFLDPRRHGGQGGVHAVPFAALLRHVAFRLAFCRLARPSARPCHRGLCHASSGRAARLELLDVAPSASLGVERVWRRCGCRRLRRHGCQHRAVRLLGLPSRRHSAALSAHVAVRRSGVAHAVADGGLGGGCRRCVRRPLAALHPCHTPHRLAVCAPPPQHRLAPDALRRPHPALRRPHPAHPRRCEHGHQPYGQRIFLYEHTPEPRRRQPPVLFHRIRDTPAGHRLALPFHV